jgi:hypothetical protein
MTSRWAYIGPEIAACLCEEASKESVLAGRRGCKKAFVEGMPPRSSTGAKIAMAIGNVQQRFTMAYSPMQYRACRGWIWMGTVEGEVEHLQDAVGVTLQCRRPTALLDELAMTWKKKLSFRDLTHETCITRLYMSWK